VGGWCGGIARPSAEVGPCGRRKGDNSSGIFKLGSLQSGLNFRWGEIGEKTYAGQLPKENEIFFWGEGLGIPKRERVDSRGKRKTRFAKMK